MTQAGDKFFNELQIFLMKNENRITNEDWTKVLSVLVAKVK